MDHLAWLRTSAVLAVIGLLVAAWKWLPTLDLRELSDWMEPHRHAWYALPLVMAVFIVLAIVPVVLLIASLLVRAVAQRFTARFNVTALIVVAGMATATGIAVVGRLQGHGQDWAYGTATQAAILVALAAAVSPCLDWFDPGPELDQGSETGEQGGGGDGPGDDLGRRTVPPAEHEHDLEPDRQPGQ